MNLKYVIYAVIFTLVGLPLLVVITLIVAVLRIGEKVIIGGYDEFMNSPEEYRYYEEDKK